MVKSRNVRGLFKHGSQKLTKEEILAVEWEDIISQADNFQLLEKWTNCVIHLLEK